MNGLVDGHFERAMEEARNGYINDVFDLSDQEPQLLTDSDEDEPDRVTVVADELLQKNNDKIITLHTLEKIIKKYFNDSTLKEFLDLIKEHKDFELAQANKIGKYERVRLTRCSEA